MNSNASNKTNFFSSYLKSIIPDDNTEIPYNFMNTNRVPKINWAKIIPDTMLHEFNSVREYKNYLSKLSTNFYTALI